MITNLIHGQSSHAKIKESKTYISWRVMKDRCQNPKNHNYDRYGGRGIDGVRKHVSDWARERGLNRTTVDNRLNMLGWSERDAIMTPLQPKNFKSHTQNL